MPARAEGDEITSASKPIRSSIAFQLPTAMAVIDRYY
jgi:hypothetical protein